MNVENRPSVIQTSLMSRLNVDHWSRPGVRQQGLSQQDFSALTAEEHAGVTQLGNETHVTYNRHELVYSYTFDENGRLTRCESVHEDDFPIVDTFQYDGFGRLTEHQFSGDNECIPSNEFIKHFEYPLSEPDSHYTETVETNRRVHQVERITWEARQALRVLSREGL